MPKLEISIKAEELTAAILKLATALEGNQIRTPSEPAEPIAETEKSSEPSPTEKPITLEAVRALLASKSQSGKQKEVKALIATYGVVKLTEIDPVNFPKLLQEAEAL